MITNQLHQTKPRISKIRYDEILKKCRPWCVGGISVIKIRGNINGLFSFGSFSFFRRQKEENERKKEV